MKPRFSIVVLASLFSVHVLTRPAMGQLCIQLEGGTVNVDFNTLAVSGSSNTIMPTGFAFLETGSGANITYAAGDGSSSTGNTYSFGTGTNIDRALGELTTTTVQSTIGACFVNNTGAPISWILIKYSGEQWRLGAADATPDRVDFQFSLTATALNNGTWTDVNALDFVSPNNVSAAGALNGNSATNRTVFPLTAIELPFAVPNNGVLFIRWVPANIAGANDGLAIDDFSITVQKSDNVCPEDITDNGTVDVDDLLELINGWGPCS